ncbi:cytochrome P450 1A5-like [Platysternon megacephalum]|uniref:Cytochrome P450 1A5-like n=1 Tax=Platysternon megacephalum TaxID=55544 RepID=A0A4D9F1U3_9SAUR|nr:cytochrome P450 1A5-like [Platysternon megacephalum]
MGLSMEFSKQDLSAGRKSKGIKMFYWKIKNHIFQSGNSLTTCSYDNEMDHIISGTPVMDPAFTMDSLRAPGRVTGKGENIQSQKIVGWTKRSWHLVFLCLASETSVGVSGPVWG